MSNNKGNKIVLMNVFIIVLLFLLELLLFLLKL